MRCQSCELARINGMVCHEAGCPFQPEGRAQHECSESCARAYAGLPCEEDEGMCIADFEREHPYTPAGWDYV